MQTFLELTLIYNKDIDFHCYQNHTLTLSSSFSFFTSPRSRICLRRKFITTSAEYYLIIHILFMDRQAD